MQISIRPAERTGRLQIRNRARRTRPSSPRVGARVRRTRGAPRAHAASDATTAALKGYEYAGRP